MADSLYDAMQSSDYVLPDWDAVGPQNDGTYQAPSSAQPINTQWESGGGTLGDYSGVLKILSQGIGAWSQSQRNKDFLDYQRYEATAGGVFTQGRPNPMQVQGAATVSAFGNPLVLIAMAVGIVLLLRK